MPTKEEWRNLYENGYEFTDTVLGGWHLVIIPAAPLPPAEEARRIVRHTFGPEFMAYIGEDVGPTPDDATGYYSPVYNILYVTRPVFDSIVKYRAARAPIRLEPIRGPEWMRKMYPPNLDRSVPDVFSL